MGHLIYFQGRNTRVKFMSRILEKIQVGSKQEPESDPKPTEKWDPDPNKTIPDPQHWFVAM
jgi:hypothetical protein